MMIPLPAQREDPPVGDFYFSVEGRLGGLQGAFPPTQNPRQHTTNMKIHAAKGGSLGEEWVPQPGTNAWSPPGPAEVCRGAGRCPSRLFIMTATWEDLIQKKGGWTITAFLEYKGRKQQGSIEMLLSRRSSPAARKSWAFPLHFVQSSAGLHFKRIPAFTFSII